MSRQIDEEAFRYLPEEKRSIAAGLTATLLGLPTPEPSLTMHNALVRADGSPIDRRPDAVHAAWTQNQSPDRLSEWLKSWGQKRRLASEFSDLYQELNLDDRLLLIDSVLAISDQLMNPPQVAKQEITPNEARLLEQETEKNKKLMLPALQKILDRIARSDQPDQSALTFVQELVLVIRLRQLQSPGNSNFEQLIEHLKQNNRINYPQELDSQLIKLVELMQIFKVGSKQPSYQQMEDLIIESTKWLDQVNTADNSPLPSVVSNALVELAKTNEYVQWIVQTLGFNSSGWPSYNGSPENRESLLRFTHQVVEATSIYNESDENQVANVGQLVAVETMWRNGVSWDFINQYGRNRVALESFCTQIGQAGKNYFDKNQTPRCLDKIIIDNPIDLVGSPQVENYLDNLVGLYDELIDKIDQSQDDTEAQNYRRTKKVIVGLIFGLTQSYMSVFETKQHQEEIALKLQHAQLELSDHNIMTKLLTTGTMMIVYEDSPRQVDSFLESIGDKRPDFIPQELTGLLDLVGLKVIRDRLLTRLSDKEFAQYFCQEESLNNLENPEGVFLDLFAGGYNSPVTPEPVKKLVELCGQYPSVATQIATFETNHHFFKKLGLLTDIDAVFGLVEVLKPKMPQIAWYLYPDTSDYEGKLANMIQGAGQSDIFDQSTNYYLFTRYLKLSYPDRALPLLVSDHLRQEVIRQLQEHSLELPSSYLDSVPTLMADFFFNGQDQRVVEDIFKSIRSNSGSLDAVRQRFNEVYLTGFELTDKKDFQGVLRKYCEFLGYVDSDGQVDPENYQAVQKILETQKSKMHSWTDINLLLGLTQNKPFFPREATADFIYQCLTEILPGKSWNPENVPIYMWQYVPLDLYSPEQINRLTELILAGDLGQEIQQQYQQTQRQLPENV